MRYWLGLSASAGRNDGLRVQLVDGDGARVATLAVISGDKRKREPRWRTLLRTLPGEAAGRRLAIQVVAVDEGRDSIVEAGVDDMRITVG
jgi:hypothetical protein